MNLELWSALLIPALLLVVILVLRAFAMARRTEPLLMHRSKWKHRLTRDARRAFETAGWKIKPGMVAGGEEVDFFVFSQLANFEIITINRTARNFRSDTRLIERMEEQSRHFRIRNGCAIHIVDGGVGTDFIASGERRGLLMIHIDDIGEITSLTKYAANLPEALSPLQLRLLESNFLACSNLCQRFKAAGEPKKAIEWARRAIKSRYGYSVHYTLFSLLLESGDLDGAEEVGKEGLSYKPKDSVSFFKGLQKIATLRGDDTEAAAWAERWVAAEPEDPKELLLAYDNLAALHERHKNGPAAALAIGNAMRLAPDDPGILRRAARIALLEGNLPAARDYAERWIIQAPRDGGAYDLLADALLRQKSFGPAAAAIAEALVLNPDSAGFLRKASIIAMESGDFTAAIRFAERWVAAAPDDAAAYDHASLIYLRAGQYEEAGLANAKALKLDPLRPNLQRRSADIAATLARQAALPPSALA